MNVHAIFHAPHGVTAYPSGPDRLTVVLRGARGDIKRVFVVYRDRYGLRNPDCRQQLILAGHDELFDYWRGDIVLHTRRLSYYFILDSGLGLHWYGAGGLSGERTSAPNERWRFVYPYIWWTEDDDPPDWTKEAIVYQIFPDRFANGNAANDPAGAKAWGRRPTRDAHFGGDIQGIIAHIDHLVHLGVNCLYLTPIFQSPSNHKYDTTDYYQIDPAFGDERTARQLVAECHARGIRVILDGVFNHCGYEFTQFQDAIKHGSASPFTRWFRIHGYPVTHPPEGPLNYQTFAEDVWRMPKLMTGNPDVSEYLTGVAEHWTRALDIDGWRLDVGEEVHPEFLRQFRRRIRKINPEAWIVGEVLHDASTFLQGDQMDAVMNYAWYDLCMEFFTNRMLDAEIFAETLANLRLRYRRSVTESNWNLLDSHDRPRLITACHGDKASFKLATAFQFTYTGVPYIYYGTEIGLPGGDDPDCRRCMPWDRTAWDFDILEHYLDLIKLRKSSPVFTRGEQIDLHADAATGIYVYARLGLEACAIVILNNGDDAVDLSLASLHLLEDYKDQGDEGVFPLCFSTSTVELPAHIRLGKRGRSRDEDRVVRIPNRSVAIYMQQF